MCGITGFYLNRNPLSLEKLKEMTDSITYRGPDDEGYYFDGTVGLGMRRLSILDLEGGHQPVYNEDKSVVVVYNGEIYNFQNLKNSLIKKGHIFRTRCDTEVLVHLYEEFGVNFPGYLNGIFAFALYDRNKESLVLARDQVGIKPLYIFEKNDGFLFSSEPKAFDTVDTLSINPEGLALYLCNDYIPNPYSFWSNVRKLRPGYTFVFDGESPVEKPYWNWHPLPPPPKDIEEGGRVLKNLIVNSVRHQCMSDVPLGVFLSGGVDSSCVTASMRLSGYKDIETFSIGFEDSSFDESHYSKIVSKHFSTLHYSHIFSISELIEEMDHLIPMLDEPFADPSMFPTSLLSRFTREKVKVALGGDGGDELFSGYPTYYAHQLLQYYRNIPQIGKKILTYFLDRIPVSYKNLSRGFLAKKFIECADEVMPFRHLHWMGSWQPGELKYLLKPDFLSEMPTFEEHPLAFLIPPPKEMRDPEYAGFIDFQTYLVEDILYKVDRASMMHSLEVRVPLLDPSIIRFALSLPYEMKRKRAKGKVILKDAFRGILPDEILNRKKKGFGIPVSAWLCGQLKERLLEITSDSFLKRTPFVPNTLRKYVKEHIEMKNDHRKRLWPLFILLSSERFKRALS